MMMAPNGQDTAIERIQRPSLLNANNNHHHHSTTSMNSLLNNNNNNTTTTGTPSLSLTPTTTASSLSTSIDYITTTTHPHYDFNTRPLPPRHDPSYSSSAGAIKGGYDLVMPHVAPPVMASSVSDHVHFHGGVWEKQTVRKLPVESSAGEVREGLGMLFGGSGVANEMEKKKMGEM